MSEVPDATGNPDPAQGDRDAALVRRLASISTLSRMLRQNAMIALKLEIGQDMLLDRLSGDRGQTVKQLANALHVRSSTISKMVSRLEADGLCRRERKATDFRMIEVRLTEVGLRMQSRVRRMLATSEHDLWTELGEADAATLRAELAKVDAALLSLSERVR